MTDRPNSGPGARPMENAWVREVRDQCPANAVAFFFKQWGGLRAVESSMGNEWSQFLRRAGLEFLMWCRRRCREISPLILVAPGRAARDSGEKTYDNDRNNRLRHR